MERNKREVITETVNMNRHNKHKQIMIQSNFFTPDMYKVSLHSLAEPVT